MQNKDEKKRGGVTNVKANPRDLLRQINTESGALSLYRTAYENGRTVSHQLEIEDPSGNYTGRAAKMDAFTRALAGAGIVTKSDPYNGIWASRWIDITDSKHKEFGTALRALAPEFVARTWRKVQFGGRQRRDLYVAGEGAEGSWERPYADAASARWDTEIAPQIPLDWMVAITTPITSGEYRIYYLTENAADTRTARVAEGTNIPTMTLTGAEHVVNLLKYGGGIEATYEAIRRQRVDKMSMHLRRMAVRAEVDKVSQILGVMVNGDGNSGTGALAHTQTGLHSGSAGGTLTLEAWLAFLQKFEQPYRCTGVIGQNGSTLKLFLLDTGSANIPLAFLSGHLGSVVPVNQDMARTPVAWSSDAPASTLVGFDGTAAIERVVEIGSSISEVEKYVKKQTEAIYMTVVEGFGKLDKNSVRTLDISS